MAPVPVHTHEHGGTLVLLHASASSARQWDALAAALPPDWRAIGVDLHGHGRQAPWQGARPLTLDDEIALVLPHLRRHAPVHLVGHSYGGAVALGCATRHPDLLACLVLYEPVIFPWLAAEGGPPWTTVKDTAIEVARRVGEGDLAAAASRFIDYWSGPGTWARMPAPRQQSVEQRMPDIARQFDTLFSETFPREAPSGLGERMLCLSGTSTVASTARIAALLERAWPQARHERLDGAGHMGPVTHVQAFNARLLAFLHSGMFEPTAA